MNPLMNERKQKFLSTLIVSVAAFLGFEAVSYTFGIYQLKQGLYLSFYIYFFHILWLTFLFDLHLKKRGVLANAKLNYKGLKMLREALKERLRHVFNWQYLRHYQNYLVLPGILYWATIVLLFLNPFKEDLKQLIIASATLAMVVAYWYMKEHISRQLEHKEHWIKVLSMVKLFGAFLIYSAALGTTFHYGFEQNFLLLTVLTVTFLLIYQALFQHRLLNFNIFIWIVIIAIVMGVVSMWVYTYWSSEYFTGGLVMLAIYNMMWGLLHHHLDKTLTKKIAFEYLAMMVLVISILFASHNFNQRVV